MNNNGIYFNSLFCLQPNITFPTSISSNTNSISQQQQPILSPFWIQQQTLLPFQNTNYLISVPSQLSSNLIFPPFGHLSSCTDSQSSTIYQSMIPFGGTHSTNMNPFNFQNMQQNEINCLNGLNSLQQNTLSENQNAVRLQSSSQQAQIDKQTSMQFPDRGRSETDIEHSTQPWSQGEILDRSRNLTQQLQGRSQREENVKFSSELASQRGIQKVERNHYEKNAEGEQKNDLKVKQNQITYLRINNKIPQPRTDVQLEQRIRLKEEREDDEEEVENSNGGHQVRKNRFINECCNSEQFHLPPLHFQVTPREKNIISKVFQQNIQSAFKNILKGFLYCVNHRFETIFAYENGNSGPVVQLDSPTTAQRKCFLQKFNKFIKNKKFNHKSIRQIIENPLYSRTLKHFQAEYSKEWVHESHFSNKEEITVVLEYFALCCDNMHLLFFLTKPSEKYILQGEEQ